MKKKYFFHPSSFSLSEIEGFYEEKARKGLFLEKRNDYFSRFRVDEPKELLYRIEVVDYRKEENRKISEAQVAVYEDCGWTYVCGNGYIHVFSADKTADVPELYYNPEDQIETVKILRKSNLRGMISILVTWLLVFLINQLSYPSRNLSETAERLSNDFYIMLIDTPAFFMGISLILVYTIGELILGISSSQYHIVKLKKGIPLRIIKPFARKLKLGLKSMLAVSVTAVLIMGFMEILSLKKDQDPSAYNGPYMTLEDFGIEKADASENLFYMEESYKRKETIWGEVIKTEEYSNTFNGSASLYQDVYQVKNENLRNKLVKAFSTSDYFGFSLYDSEKITVDGLDEVFILDQWQMVVVKEDIVIRMLYHLDDELSQEEILLKISEILNRRELSLEK
ncbi:MAG TPA: DUF2812 domain-containing protein [Proteiniclasticum sp.]|nr:DUF2812 domain-containing protein [Proteiniclasticum sp.]